jgi:hypothetical protein
MRSAKVGVEKLETVFGYALTLTALRLGTVFLNTFNLRL